MRPTANGESERERENKKQACLHFSLFSCGCLWLDMPQILRNMGFLCYFTSHSWVKLFKPQVFGGQRMADPKNSADTYLCCFRTPNEETTTEPREAAEVSHESSLPLRTQKFFTRTLEMSRNALLHRCDRGDTFCHWQLWVLSCSSMLPAPVGGGSNWGFWGSIDLGFTGNTPKNGNLNFNRNKTADLMDLCCLVDAKIAM